MTLFSKQSGVAGLTAAFGVLALVFVQGQAKPMCDPDNGGLKLPAGFCALVVADNLGPARHMAVAPNGDLYVALQTSGGRGQPQTGGGAVALRDANGDGRFEVKEPFGSGSTTGIALRNGYVYLAHPTDGRTDADDRRPAEADWHRGDDRDRPARRAAARGQGHRVRRQRLALHQRGRAVERLPESRSPPWRERAGSVSAAREARRHLEVRREQSRTRRRSTAARASRPACVRCRRSPGTTVRCTSRCTTAISSTCSGPDVHREGQRRAPGGAVVSRGAGLGFRLAVLLLRLRV